MNSSGAAEDYESGSWSKLTSRINQQHAIRESFRLAQEKIGGSSLLSTTHDSSCNDGHRDPEAYADDAFEPYSDSDDLSSDGADEDREAAELLRRTTVSAYGNWDSAAGRDSNTADESAFFLRQQYRDLVDQNNDGVLLKAKMMLKSWSEEEERAENISEEFRHAMDLGGDPALARRVQRLVAEAERPVRRKAVVKQAEKLSCVVPRVAAASATLESKRKAMVKETRPLDVARERMKQQGQALLTKQRQAEDRARRLEKEQKLRVAYTKADIMFDMHRLKTIRKSFAGWQQYMEMLRLQLNKFKLRQDFIAQSRIFMQWRRHRMRRIHHREEIRLKCELKEQAERESFAYTRFARVTQCRVFGTWLARYRDTKEERSLIDFHATLARKKQQMLEAVAFQMNEQAKAKLAKMEDMEQMAKVELSSTAEEPSLPLPTRSPRDPSPSKTVKHVDSSPTKPIRSPIKSTVQPKLLDGMAKREQERQLRREEVQRRKEEKRLQQEALEEEARLRKEAEEQAAKLAEMELRRQKAQQLKEEEERKEMARLLRIQHLSESRKFDDGRCVRAMWSKWKRICAKHRKREEVAAKVDEVMIQKRTWRAMGLAFAAVQLRRSEDAAKWQQARTQSCFIYLWRKRLQHFQRNCFSATRLHNNTLKRGAVKSWYVTTKLRQDRALDWELSMEDKVRIFTKRRLQRLAIASWRQYIVEEKEEKWRAYRKDVLRNRARELLLHSRLEKGLREIVNEE